jgi:hypothetical protein
MTGIPMIDGVDGLTAEWCSRALARAAAGAEVTEVSREPVGTGQVADTVRLRLRYDPPGAGPAAVVAKVSSASPVSRAAARATRTYEVEAAFYRDLAPVLPVRAPHCFHTAHDPATDAYVVLLEDLSPAQPGDQLTGCTPDEAAAAVAELPLLHAPLWDDPTLDRLDWLHGISEERAMGFAALVAGLLDGFLDRYRGDLEADVVELVGRFVPRLADHLLADHGPSTVVHGDYRLDNLLFGGPRVVVLDWQTVSRGPAVADLSYFLGAGLLVADRRAHEAALVDDYRRRMATMGVELDRDEVWESYRRHAFSGLIMAIIASMLVTRTDRGDRMFVTMANRHGRHAIDLDSEALIPS